MWSLMVRPRQLGGAASWMNSLNVSWFFLQLHGWSPRLVPDLPVELITLLVRLQFILSNPPAGAPGPCTVWLILKVGKLA